MSEGGGGTVLQYVRIFAIVALVAINIVLIGLNLQKHEIFPFEPEVEAQSGLPG
jgi:hypothetical protein